MKKTDSALPSPDSLYPALETLLGLAKRAGAESVDVLAAHGRSLSVSVRDGELEDVDNSEGRDIGLRVMLGSRQACVSSSDLSSTSLEKLAERAVAMATLAPEDPYLGLADQSLLGTDAHDLDLADPTQMDAQSLLERAKVLEQSALSIDGVKQAEGASASAGASAVAFMTSHGFKSGWQSTRHGISVAAIAEKDGAMERDYDYQSLRFFNDLDALETIGTNAGKRAAARLGSSKMKSGEMPVMFERRLAGNLLTSFLSAISGTSIARGVSFLKDSMNTQVFAPSIQIMDDPHIKRGPASRPWDGEGVDIGKSALVENGILKSWLLNTATANKLGLTTTGHASRSVSSPPGISSSNTFIQNGETSPAAMIKAIDHGLMVTEMFGPSINPNTGDYSVGVAGFEIRNGEHTRPVSEITIAGNLKTMFMGLSAANDLKLDRSNAAPTLRIDKMVVAGD